tara:strand:- start:51 stop:1070 length:1020 start_codon:yes stop_codon:yes gene_type:complete
MKKIKIVFINFLVFLGFIFLIEAIFGNWFKNNNFGFSIRELRNVSTPMSVKYNGQKYDYIFKRNKIGFIGEEIDPEDIKVVFLGGSTGEEMFKPIKHSIVGSLNQKLKDNNIDLKIINASKGGKTTRGYINDFKYWFSKINNFNPKIFIFYTGLNDSSLTLPDHFDQPYKNKLSEKLEDYMKNNSFFYEYKKKIENKYFNELRKYYGLVEKNLYDNFDLINYEKAKKKFANLKPNEEIENVFKNFSKNLDNLKEIIDNQNITPIFITQIQYDGLNNYALFITNEYLKQFCKVNGYSIIKLDEMNYKLDNKDFYDHVHTTVQGSLKISNLIFSDLRNILN